MDSDRLDRKDKRNFIYMLIFLALVLLSSICIFNAVMSKESELEKTEGETFETPEQAYIETKRIIEDVSVKLNKGIFSIEKIKHLE